MGTYGTGLDLPARHSAQVKPMEDGLRMRGGLSESDLPPKPRHWQTGGEQAPGTLHHVIVRGIEKSAAGGLMPEQERES